MRKYLITLRTAHGLSQQDVANKAGITRQYYQQIEAGTRQRRIDVSLLTAIGRAFGLSLTDIADLEAEAISQLESLEDTDMPNIRKENTK